VLDLQVLYLVQNLSLASVKYTSVLPFWYRLKRAGSPGQRAIKWACVCVLVQNLQPEAWAISVTFSFTFRRFWRPSVVWVCVQKSWRKLPRLTNTLRCTNFCVVLYMYTKRVPVCVQCRCTLPKTVVVYLLCKWWRFVCSVNYDRQLTQWHRRDNGMSRDVPANRSAGIWVS